MKRNKQRGTNMGDRRPVIVITAILALFLAGCALGPASLRDKKKSKPRDIPQEVKEESRNLNRIRAEYNRTLQRIKARTAEIKPVMPKYDPLDNKIVSFSLVDEDMRTVLFVLAQAVRMNIIIDPSIAAEESKITLHFERVPASKVLKHVLKSFDLSYEIDGNVIAIRPMTEKIFTLNFLDTNTSTTYDVGGDVLGAGDEETVSGLSGTFRLTGEGSKKGNEYDTIETMIRPMLTAEGKFALNRIAGTLYVKDTPATIQAVEKLMNNFKEMLGRQIQIDAQIIEVTLSDEHRWGINWDMLKDDPTTGDQLSRASWSLGGGLLMQGVAGNFSITATINALNMFGDTKVVSNPTIRCKHGKPAIISVGTSYTYKKSVKTTTTGTGDSARDTTEVDVSTVFDGLILGVVPFIERNGRITLLINPIKSEVDPSSLEPQAVGGANASDSISLPEINVKEINTTIALHDGDAIILGGLIDRRKVVDNRGIPLLSAIPIIGYLFKNEFEREETRELVLVLSVNLV